MCHIAQHACDSTYHAIRAYDIHEMGVGKTIVKNNSDLK